MEQRVSITILIKLRSALHSAICEGYRTGIVIEDIECVEGIASDRCLMGWGRCVRGHREHQQKREQWSRAPTELRNDTGGAKGHDGARA